MQNEINAIQKEDDEWFSQADEERKSHAPVQVEEILSPPSRKEDFNKSIYSPAVSAVMELSLRGGLSLS